MKTRKDNSRLLGLEWLGKTSENKSSEMKPKQWENNVKIPAENLG